MNKFSKFVGLDTHADTIAVSIAEALGGRPRYYGEIPNRPASVARLVKKLSEDGELMSFCYEAGPCGYGLYRQITSLGHECDVVAPSLIPTKPGDRVKTDRRDAAALSEVLWVNRGRLLQGKPVRGLRQVDITAKTDREDRRLTTLRKQAGQARARLINAIKQMLRRHNLQWNMPTKIFPTKTAIAWLKKLVLPAGCLRR